MTGTTTSFSAPRRVDWTGIGLAVILTLVIILPLLVVALAVVAVLRLLARRRPGSSAALSASSVVNVPDAAAFQAQGSAAGRAVAARPAAAAYQRGQRMAGQPDGWMVVPVWRDAPPSAQRGNVIDAEVIEEDQHHG